jgi:hypothetical protein
MQYLYLLFLWGKSIVLEIICSIKNDYDSQNSTVSAFASS